MTALSEQEIERRLEQSKRLLQGTVDPMTTERIGRLIGELEQEKRLDKERYGRQWGPLSSVWRRPVSIPSGPV
jgi:hypothetical protein